MTMRLERSDERRRRRERKRIFFFVGVCAGLFLFGGFLFRIFAPATLALFHPVAGAFQIFKEKTAFIFSLPLSKANLLSENARLKEELLQKEELLAQLRFRAQEAEYRDLIFGEGSEGKHIALIVSRPGHSPYDTFTVDKGEAAGVARGDRVFFQGVALGDVDEVSAHRARITLFSSPGRELAVFLGKSRIEAVATGRGGGNFEARLPQGVEIGEGDEVVLPASGESLFATVGAIEARSSDTFQRVFFKLPVNISELRMVEIRPPVL